MKTGDEGNANRKKHIRRFPLRINLGALGNHHEWTAAFTGVNAGTSINFSDLITLPLVSGAAKRYAKIDQFSGIPSTRYILMSDTNRMRLKNQSTRTFTHNFNSCILFPTQYGPLGQPFPYQLFNARVL